MFTNYMRFKFFKFSALKHFSKSEKAKQSRRHMKTRSHFVFPNASKKSTLRRLFVKTIESIFVFMVASTSINLMLNESPSSF